MPAVAVGAPHGRDRIWFVAHRGSKSKSCRSLFTKDSFDFNEQWSDSEKWGINRVKSKVGTETIPGLSIGWEEINTAPHLPRMVDGLSNGMDRLHCLGNAVVPQIVTWIGRQIIHADAGR